MAFDHSNPLVFGVSDFIAIVNQTLDYAFQTVYLEGEVSSFKVNQGKFVFFDLKDNDGVVSCFMSLFSLRVPIKDGMKVIVRGVPKLTNKGRFSITVQAIKPTGEGSIKKSFDLLKKKLSDEGLFDIARKRQLPEYPKNITVISSTQAAGYADFIKILNDRWGGMKVEVLNVAVQGESAPDQIINAINYVNESQDLSEVIVLIRGGGSAEDLMAFNDEQLARVLAGSRVPTLVGVGHETDETICDLVADVRAATPSNAAQIIVPDKREIIQSTRQRLDGILSKTSAHIDIMFNSVQLSIGSIGDKITSRIDGLLQRLTDTQSLLSELNPEKVLKRGYAIIRGTIDIGNTLEIEMMNNIVKAEVKDVKRK